MGAAMFPATNMDAAMLAAQQQVLIERLIAQQALLQQQQTVASQKQQDQLLMLAQQQQSSVGADAAYTYGESVCKPRSSWIIKRQMLPRFPLQALLRTAMS
ncbi:hypothetical protein OS493_003027 [Desmophyllum pertusum]|uniref:Uncharacterized protein n=1 Tax=Desmophyllum pertusum TaxID=174260 RepID=A0A9W9YGF2_9CNID|nr:hypothetical protein OS493_003027 [Desmophyllum pertusum]